MLTPQNKVEAPVQGVVKFYNYANSTFSCDIDRVHYEVPPQGTLAMKTNDAQIMAKYLMEDYLYSDEAKSIPGGVSKDVGADPRREEYIGKALIPLDITPGTEAQMESEVLNLNAEAGALPEQIKKKAGRPKKVVEPEFPELEETNEAPAED